MEEGKDKRERIEEWTYERCLKLARDCFYVTEMKAKSSGAYNASRKNGWLKDYTWFKYRHLGYKCNNGIWTESTCREEALKYTTKRDFKKANHSAYRSAKYHGWFKDYTWLRDGRGSGITRSTGYKSLINNHCHPKYTNEQIIEAAKKYTKKVDFLHNDNPLYHAALNRGMMAQFTWLKSSAHLFDSINFVYRYYFKTENAVYVGRTINPKERDFEHHRQRGEESSIVLKYAQEKGISIPPMEILAKNLSGIDSQRVEDEYVQKYRAEAMHILNKGATGIGRGSMGMKKKYSKQKFLNIARQYTELSEFQSLQHGAYEAGCKNGWIHECDWLTRKVRKSSLFTKEFCMDIARQCTSRNELEKKDATVYGKMIKTGWLEECDWLVSAHKGRKDLSYDYCIEIAKGYKTANQINKEHRTVAKKLYKTGWIEECYWLLEVRRPVNQYTLEGVFVGRYSSSYAAEKSFHERFKYFHQAIARACEGKNPSAYGFIWRYADADDMKHPKQTLVHAGIESALSPRLDRP